MYYRELCNQVKKTLFKGKIIILYGPRQVGKTTLVNQINHEYSSNSQYYLADRPNVQELFKYENIDRNLSQITEHKLVIIDEAQSIPNIGLVLKIIHDTNPDIQLLVTGSSSFDLANKLSEPLTGRSIIFKLFPLSVKEIVSAQKPIFAKEILSKMLVWGSYPEVYFPQKVDSFLVLENIAQNYLYKDIFSLVDLKKPQVLKKILQALAFQIGGEVSYSEIANLAQTTVATVENYIDILEKAFIIFKLSALSRNHRSEIGKSRKIFFWDLGIRNYLINNLNQIDLRNDQGQLWENFLVVERLKFLEYNNISREKYFWRNYAQAEVDYLEEYDGIIDAYEFKWNSKKAKKIPRAIQENYNLGKFEVVNPDNFENFLKG